MPNNPFRVGQTVYMTARYSSHGINVGDPGEVRATDNDGTTLVKVGAYSLWLNNSSITAEASETPQDYILKTRVVRQVKRTRTRTITEGQLSNGDWVDLTDAVPIDDKLRKMASVVSENRAESNLYLAYALMKEAKKND